MSIVSELSQQHLNLQKESEFYFQFLSSDVQFFDLQERAIKYIEDNASKQEFEREFQRIFVEESGKVSIQYFSKANGITMTQNVLQKNEQISNRAAKLLSEDFKQEEQQDNESE